LRHEGPRARLLIEAMGATTAAPPRLAAMGN